MHELLDRQAFRDEEHLLREDQAPAARVRVAELPARSGRVPRADHGRPGSPDEDRQDEGADRESGREQALPAGSGEADPYAQSLQRRLRYQRVRAACRARDRRLDGHDRGRGSVDHSGGPEILCRRQRDPGVRLVRQTREPAIPRRFILRLSDGVFQPRHARDRRLQLETPQLRQLGSPGSCDPDDSRRGREDGSGSGLEFRRLRQVQRGQAPLRPGKRASWRGDREHRRVPADGGSRDGGRPLQHLLLP